MRHVIALLALTSLTACGTAGDFNLRTLTMPANIDATALEGQELQADFSGEMPHVGSFSDTLATAEIAQWDDITHVTIDSFDGESWKMINVSLIDNGRDGYRYSAVGGLGCTGTEEDSADLFDESPDDVMVDAELVEIDGEPMVELTVTSDFGRRGEAVGVAYLPVED